MASRQCPGSLALLRTASHLMRLSMPALVTRSIFAPWTVFPMRQQSVLPLVPSERAACRASCGCRGRASPTKCARSIGGECSVSRARGRIAGVAELKAQCRVIAMLSCLRLPVRGRFIFWAIAYRLSSSGSLAIFAAMRRASSFMSRRKFALNERKAFIVLSHSW